MTHGSLDMRNGWFILKSDPYVRLKVKRLFPAAQDLGTGIIQLKSNAASAEDIQMIIDRWPHEVRGPVRQWIAATCETNEAKRVSTRRILAAGTGDLPGLQTAIPLRDYQLAAVELARVNPGLLIGDDLGLGKSAEAIGIIADGNAPALIVCQTHLQRQWADQVAKFCPHLRTHIVKQKADYNLPPHQVTICSYSKLSAWAERLEWKCVVWDECQELRGDETEKGQAAHFIAEVCPVRIGLSATPIYNYAGEIWNVMQAITPGHLGTKTEFCSEWKCDNKGRVQDPIALGEWMRGQGCYIRRTREQVGKELPPVETISHIVEHDPKIMARMTALGNELAVKVLKGTFSEKGIASRELDSRLRQITGLAKAPFVADFVAGLVENGERLILAGWHREVYEVWQKVLTEKGIRHALYTGTESPAQKNLHAARFIAGEIDVLILSLRSGAGLDGLQTASNTVVIGELDWSPKVIEQLIGRLRRDGQEKRVTAFYLVAEDGSDPIIARLLANKWNSSTAVTDPSRLNADVTFEQPEESRIAELAKEWLRKHAS